MSLMKIVKASYAIFIDEDKVHDIIRNIIPYIPQVDKT